MALIVSFISVHLSAPIFPVTSRRFLAGRSVSAEPFRGKGPDRVRRSVFLARRTAIARSALPALYATFFQVGFERAGSPAPSSSHLIAFLFGLQFTTFTSAAIVSSPSRRILAIKRRESPGRKKGRLPDTGAASPTDWGCCIFQ